MIITISGLPGSGKSSVAKMLAEKLHYKHYSMGDLQRELAKEHGLTIKEWGEFEKKDPKYDHMIDDKQTALGKEKDNFVIDSWLAPKFIPHAVKIFLKADIDVRVKRRLYHKRKEEQFKEFEEAKKDMLEREKINTDRWLTFYSYDYHDEDNYDYIIDANQGSVQEIVDTIVRKINKETFK